MVNLLPIQETQKMQLDPWAGKIPRRKMETTSRVFLLGRFHGQRPGELQSIVGHEHDWNFIQKALKVSFTFKNSSLQCGYLMEEMRLEAEDKWRMLLDSGRNNHVREKIIDSMNIS